MIEWKNKPEHSMYNVLLFEYVHKTILYISNSIYMYTKAKKNTCEDKHRTSNIDYMGRDGRGKWGEEVEEEDVSSAVVFSPLTKENIRVPYLCGLKCLHGGAPSHIQGLSPDPPDGPLWRSHEGILCPETGLWLLPLCVSRILLINPPWSIDSLYHLF